MTYAKAKAAGVMSNPQWFKVGEIPESLRGEEHTQLMKVVGYGLYVPNTRRYRTEFRHEQKARDAARGGERVYRILCDQFGLDGEGVPVGNYYFQPIE